MPAATAAERHAARARIARSATTLPRRVSGRVGTVSRPRAVPVPPRPVTGVFDRIKALPDHRVIDRLLRGRVWICFIGIALMGIVAMQVSMLKLNSGISRAVETTATLERQNSDMEARIARLASGERIRTAADKGGMVPPAAGELHYLRVRGGIDGRLAARRMRAPSDDAKALMANHGVVPGSLMAPVTPAVPATTAPTVAATPAATPAVTPAATPVAPAVTPVPTPAATVQPTTVTPAATTAPTG
jgi:cell division protein FtsL